MSIFIMLVGLGTLIWGLISGIKIMLTKRQESIGELFLIKRNWGKGFKRIGIGVLIFFVCTITFGMVNEAHDNKIKAEKLAAYHKTPEYKAKVAKEKAEAAAKLKAEEAKKKAEQIKKAKEEAKRKAEEIVKKKAEAAKKAKEEKKAKIIAEQQAKIAKIKKVGEEYNNWIDSQFNPWSGHEDQVEDMIKNELNDPESYRMLKTTYKNLGLHVGIEVYVEFTASNAFGGTVRNMYIAKIDYKTKMIHGHFVQ